MTLPDGMTATFDDDDDWAEKAPEIVKVWNHSKWWMGDVLNAAPSAEAVADLHWSSPLLEPLETATVRKVAEAIQGDRRLDIPWSYHQRVVAALLPDDLQDFMLKTAAANDYRFVHLQELIQQWFQSERGRQLSEQRVMPDDKEPDDDA